LSELISTFFSSSFFFNRAEIEKKVEIWRKSLEDRDLKITKMKSKYLEFNGERSDVARRTIE